MPVLSKRVSTIPKPPVLAKSWGLSPPVLSVAPFVYVTRIMWGGWGGLINFVQGYLLLADVDSWNLP